MHYNRIIELLKLKELPGEGGYYRESYQSSIKLNESSLNASSFKGERFASACIYYLVTPLQFSALHQLKQDEIFHYYLGDPVEMLQIHKDGTSQIVTIGPDLENGQTPQVVVPAGIWQGTRLIEGGSWCLMGTTTAPGFDYRDFELGNRDEMTQRFPHLSDLIRTYTR